MKPKINTRLKKKLARAYFNPGNPGSYGGKDRLYRSLKLTKAERLQAEQWFLETDSYTLFRPTRKRFQRRKTLVAGIDQCWQIDLTILNNEASLENEGVNYILFVIDVFSKYAWARPLKSKNASEVTNAFRSIIDSERRSPFSLQSDKGKEFLNKKFQQFLREKNIHHYTTDNDDIKASIVERLQRTIKERIQRYLNHNDSIRFIDDLDKFMKSYNTSYHSTIKMNPSDVNKENQETIWNQVYVPSNPFSVSATKNKIKVSDIVRISKTKGTFEKGYVGNWSGELFTVVKILNTNPITYKIEDDAGEEISGSWYATELQKVNAAKDKIFKVESVVGRRKLGKRLQYLVKWVGYPSKFNSYIDKGDLVEYNN